MKVSRHAVERFLERKKRNGSNYYKHAEQSIIGLTKNPDKIRLTPCNRYAPKCYKKHGFFNDYIFSDNWIVVYDMNNDLVKTVIKGSLEECLKNFDTLY